MRRAISSVTTKLATAIEPRQRRAIGSSPSVATHTAAPVPSTSPARAHPVLADMLHAMRPPPDLRRTSSAGAIPHPSARPTAGSGGQGPVKTEPGASNNGTSPTALFPTALPGGGRGRRWTCGDAHDFEEYLGGDDGVNWDTIAELASPLAALPQVTLAGVSGAPATSSSSAAVTVQVPLVPTPAPVAADIDPTKVYMRLDSDDSGVGTSGTQGVALSPSSHPRQASPSHSAAPAVSPQAAAGAAGNQRRRSTSISV